MKWRRFGYLYLKVILVLKMWEKKIFFKYKKLDALVQMNVRGLIPSDILKK